MYIFKASFNRVDDSDKTLSLRNQLQLTSGHQKKTTVNGSKSSSLVHLTQYNYILAGTNYSDK